MINIPQNLRDVLPHATYFPSLTPFFGSLSSNILMSYLMDIGRDREWFPASNIDITKATGMTRTEQRIARAILRHLGLIEEKVAGLPPTVHFFIKWDKIIDRAEKTFENQELVDLLTKWPLFSWSDPIMTFGEHGQNGLLTDKTLKNQELADLLTKKSHVSELDSMFDGLSEDESSQLIEKIKLVILDQLSGLDSTHSETPSGSDSGELIREHSSISGAEGHIKDFIEEKINYKEKDKDSQLSLFANLSPVCLSSKTKEKKKNPPLPPFGGVSPEAENEPKNGKRVAKSELSDDLFLAFWQAYPRKDAKKDCLKAWSSAVKNRVITLANIQDIMQALEAQKKSQKWQKNHGEFVPMPATWVRGERWNDSVEPTQESSGERWQGFYDSLKSKEKPVMSERCKQLVSFVTGVKGANS